MKFLYSMVGMKYHKALTIVANMQRGTPLILRRDKENPVDSNAVGVWHEGKLIAYVKATEATELAQAMDAVGKTELPGIFTVGADRWSQVEIDL
jgi:hypothetical protein